MKSFVFRTRQLPLRRGNRYEKCVLKNIESFLFLYTLGTKEIEI